MAGIIGSCVCRVGDRASKLRFRSTSEDGAFCKALRGSPAAGLILPILFSQKSQVMIRADPVTPNALGSARSGSFLVCGLVCEPSQYLPKLGRTQSVSATWNHQQNQTVTHSHVLRESHLGSFLNRRSHVRVVPGAPGTSSGSTPTRARSSASKRRPPSSLLPTTTWP